MSPVEELTLWDARDPIAPPPPAPPTTADEMSRAAASTIAGVAGSIRRRVAEELAEAGPLAEWELERALELGGNTVRPRLWELVRAQLVETRGRGVTPSGRACHLYALTPAGVRALDDLEA